MRYMKIPTSNYIICNPNIWFRIFSKFIDLLFAYPYDIMLNQMLYGNFLWMFSNLAKIIVCTHNEVVITRNIILANIFVTHLELIFFYNKNNVNSKLEAWKRRKLRSWIIFLTKILLKIYKLHILYTKHTLKILLILWRICANYEISGLKSIW